MGTPFARSLLLAATACVLGTVGVTDLSFAQEAAGRASASKGALEEIIVTSTKRRVNLQKAPVAISVVGAAEIKAQHITDVRALADSAPGIAFSESDPFDQQIAIRGIVTVHLGDATAEPSVATFIDGVYVGGQGTTMVDFYDIDHIEITRGPQGVLLGKNVAGGAISITNAEPKFQNSGSIEIGYGDYNSSYANGYYTGAITPDLAGRIAFQLRDSDGFSKNILRDRDMNGYTSGQVRGELLYRPSDRFQALTTIEYGQQYTNGLARTAVQDPFSAAPGAQTTYERQHGYSDRETVDPDNDYTRQKAISATERIDWAVFPGAKLTSISNVTIGTGAENFQQLQAPSPPLLLDSAVYKKLAPHEYSEDLRLVSDTNAETRFDYILGLYAYHNTESTDFDNFAVQDKASCAAFGGFLCGHSFYFEHLDNDTDAAYGQLGYKILPNLRVTAGVRYLQDIKSGQRGAYCFNTGQPLCSTPLGIPPGTGFKVPFDKGWYATTPQVGITYQVTPTSMAYFSWSRGFKGGGYDENPLNATTATIAFNPEKADNYEIGTKNDFLDHKLRLNVALYYLSYNNLQVEEINQVCLCLITQNAASAISKGVEAEAQFLVADGVKVFANEAFVDAHYLNFIDVGVDDSHHQLQFSPRFKTTVGVDLNPDFGGALGRSLDFRADYTFQSRFYIDPSQTDYQNGFGVLNMSLTYHPENQPWSVSLWGRNLTDTTYITYGQAFVGDIQETLAPPLTFGGSVHYDFH